MQAKKHQKSVTWTNRASVPEQGQGQWNNKLCSSILIRTGDDVTANDSGKTSCDAKADGGTVANIFSGFCDAHDAVCCFHELLFNKGIQ